MDPTVAVTQQEAGEKKPKCTWPPLEANEVAINKYLEKIGIKGVRCVEIWDFDDQLATILKPHFALILCFSNYKKAEELMKPIYDKLSSDGAKTPDGLFFMKQKISNACGTFALFHAIAQNADKIDIGQGSFGKWFSKAKELDVEDRSDSLANDEALTADHKECASSGQSEMPKECVENHFICYTCVEGRLYETDSRMCCPRDCGPTTSDSILQDAGNVCKELFAKMVDGNFSAIALVAADKEA